MTDEHDLRKEREAAATSGPYNPVSATVTIHESVRVLALTIASLTLLVALLRTLRA